MTEKSPDSAHLPVASDDPRDDPSRWLRPPGRKAPANPSRVTSPGGAPAPSSPALKLSLWSLGLMITGHVFVMLAFWWQAFGELLQSAFGLMGMVYAFVFIPYIVRALGVTAAIVGALDLYACYSRAGSTEWLGRRKAVAAILIGSLGWFFPTAHELGNFGMWLGTAK